MGAKLVRPLDGKSGNALTQMCNLYTVRESAAEVAKYFGAKLPAAFTALRKDGARPLRLGSARSRWRMRHAVQSVGRHPGDRLCGGVGRARREDPSVVLRKVPADLRLGRLLAARRHRGVIEFQARCFPSDLVDVKRTGELSIKMAGVGQEGAPLL